MASVKAYAPFGMIGISGLISTLAYFLGFGGEQTLIPIEMDFGMQLDPTAGPSIKVWARAPLPALIQVLMFNVSRKEDDGTVTGGLDMFELFPTGDDTSHGGAWTEFSMTLIEASEEPVLNMTMNMVPMVFKRDIEMGLIVTCFLWMVAFVVNSWNLYSWGMVGGSVGVLALGILLHFREMNKEKETLVTPIVPE